MSVEIDQLETRILQAVHEPDAEGVDLEQLAHEIAGSDDAQAYLVELVDTLSAMSPDAPAVERAAALLEHGLAIVAEHAVVEGEQAASTAATRSRERDPHD